VSGCMHQGLLQFCITAREPLSADLLEVRLHRGLGPDRSTASAALDINVTASPVISMLTSVPSGCPDNLAVVGEQHESPPPDQKDDKVQNVGLGLVLGVGVALVFIAACGMRWGGWGMPDSEHCSLARLKSGSLEREQEAKGRNCIAV
jgi:hypothetical protein